MRMTLSRQAPETSEDPPTVGTPKSASESAPESAPESDQVLPIEGPKASAQGEAVTKKKSKRKRPTARQRREKAKLKKQKIAEAAANKSPSPSQKTVRSQEPPVAGMEVDEPQGSSKKVCLHTSLFSVFLLFSLIALFCRSRSAVRTPQNLRHRPRRNQGSLAPNQLQRWKLTLTKMVQPRCVSVFCSSVTSLFLLRSRLAVPAPRDLRLRPRKKQYNPTIRRSLKLELKPCVVT